MRRVLWLGGALLVGAAALAAHELWQRAGPPPPLPAELATLDPLVRARVEEAAAAVERRPRSRDAWLRLGAVYEANGLFGPAESCYRALVASRPDDAKALHRLACVEERGGDLERAVETMARAAAADPSIAASWVRVAWWSLDLGAVERAEAALEEARARAPRDPGVCLAEVRLELARGDPVGAAALLRGSELLAGEHAGYAHHLLALALRDAGDLAGAEAAHARSDGRRFVLDDDWAREVRREETGYAALRLRAGRDVLARRFDEAEEKLARLLQRDPEDAHALDLLAVCRLERGDAAGALALLERVLELEPDHVEAAVHSARAVLAGARDDPARLELAERRLRGALGHRSDDPALWRLAAALAEARGDPAGVVEALDRVTELDPAASDMRARAAYATLELGELDGALARFRALQRDDPAVIEAWYGEALALVRAGRHDEARAALETLSGRPGADPRRLERLRAELR